MSNFCDRINGLISTIAVMRDYEILKSEEDSDSDSESATYYIRTSNGDCIVRFLLMSSGNFVIMYYQCDGFRMISIAYNGYAEINREIIDEINFDEIEYEVSMLGESFDEESEDNEECDDDCYDEDEDSEEDCEYEELSDERYYDVLNLQYGASQKEIKVAYIKMSKKYHPDVNKSKNAKEKMQEINEAYNALKAA
jgi:hypothetical protein